MTPLRSSAPTLHNTEIARPRWVDRLPNHISKMVVSTVRVGGPSLTVSSNPTISLPGFCALPVFVLNWLPYEANAA